MKIVKVYNDGNLGTNLFAKKYHISHESKNILDYYNNERIKIKLSGLSPVVYRKQATQLAT